MIEVKKSLKVLRGGFILSGVNENKDIEVVVLDHPAEMNGFIVSNSVNIERTDSYRLIIRDCDWRIVLDD